MNKEKNSIYTFENDIFSFKSYKNQLHASDYLKFENESELLGLKSKINDLIKGETVNETENQSAFHPKYRNSFYQQKHKEIQARRFFNRCIESVSEKHKKINIITIGIGGSYEGSKLLLECFGNPIGSDTSIFEEVNYDFITGSDPSEFEIKTKSLSAQNTFFIVSSKSFTTDEVIESFKKALKWSSDERKFIAITANPDEAKKYGIKEIITFDKEIGGRYSIWSPITQFQLFGNERESFMGGGNQADKDILDNDEYLNFVKKMSFTDIYSNNKGMNTRVILSYLWNLRSLPDYFQQLEMESLGKPLNKELKYKKTGQIIFGGYGPTAQHSYFQMLHQGTQNFSVDIIVNYQDKKNLSYAQAITQSKLLSHHHEDLKDDEMINSNVPVNLFEIKKLDPFSLGYLIATWEYRTYVSAIMLGINPFDQFGVRAGKIYTKKYLADIN